MVERRREHDGVERRGAGAWIEGQEVCLDVADAGRWLLIRQLELRYDLEWRPLADRWTGPARRAIGILSAAALAGSEENARGHLVITAPTGGSAGVMS